MSTYLDLLRSLEEQPRSDFVALVRAFLVSIGDPDRLRSELGDIDSITPFKFTGWLHDRRLINDFATFYANQQAEESREPIHFANRTEEVKTILKLAQSKEREANRIFFISAPAGFGKSALLAKVSEGFIEEGYDCVSIKVSNQTPLDQFVQILSEAFCLDVDAAKEQEAENLTPGVRFASRWNIRYRKRLAEQKLLSGLVMLVDCEGIPAKPLIDGLVGDFIKDVWRTLKGNARRPHVLLIIAGRALENLGLPNDPDVMVLSPFTYKSVTQTAQLYLPESDADDLARAAAHVLFLTGGHPWCMARMLQAFVKSGQTADQYFAPENSRRRWYSIVRLAVEEIEQEIASKSPGLREIIDSLCVFRYVGHEILQDHCDRHSSEECRDSDQLSDLLKRSYWFTGELYLSDGISRQLVTIKLRNTEPEKLIELCNQAASTCLQLIKDGAEPSMWALEYLFQRLQAQTIEPHVEAQDRREALQIFLRTEVPLVIKALHDAHPRWNLFRAHTQLMDNKLSEEIVPKHSHWEFVFLLNYLFRDEEYDNTPIQALRELLRAQRDLYKPE